MVCIHGPLRRPRRRGWAAFHQRCARSSSPARDRFWRTFAADLQTARSCAPSSTTRSWTFFGISVHPASQRIPLCAFSCWLAAWLAHTHYPTPTPPHRADHRTAFTTSTTTPSRSAHRHAHYYTDGTPCRTHSVRAHPGLSSDDTLFAVWFVRYKTKALALQTGPYLDSYHTLFICHLQFLLGLLFRFPHLCFAATSSYPTFTAFCYTFALLGLPHEHHARTWVGLLHNTKTLGHGRHATHHSCV